MTKIQNEFQLKTKDNLELFGRGWFPESSANAIILFVHGIGEHTGRYVDWANRFIDARYSFYAFDHRGHGKSEGKRGHAPSLNHFLDDIEIFKKYLQEAFPDIPIVLYGHSMGGNIVLNYLIRKEQDFAAAIVTSPWIRVPFKIPEFKMALAKIANALFPSVVQPSGLIAEHISRDPKIVEAYMNDPLNHDRISARMFMELYMSGLQLPSKAKNVELPLILMHGKPDQITSAEATEEFASRAGDNVRLKIWRSCYHELHNEPNKKRVHEFIITNLKEILFNIKPDRNE